MSGFERRRCGMRFRQTRAAAAVVGALAVAVGAGIAVAQPDYDDTPISGDALAKASAAALAITGGGTVTQTEVGNENGRYTVYKVEVTRSDGRQVDVQLDTNFAVLGSTTDPPGPDALAKAEQVALAFTGGGTVTKTDVGDEHSLYTVEVRRSDGRQVDVRLDQNFAVVGSKTDW
jgi:uncharacterized membrane protein YkoI